MKRALQHTYFFTVSGALNILIVLIVMMVLHVGPFRPSAIFVEPAAPATTTTNRHIQVAVGVPRRIVIESLDIDLKVRDGQYNPTSQEWTLDNESVFHASPTILPNNTRGNSLLYGHNIPEVFSQLHDLELGSIMKIYTSNNRIFYYTYKEAVEVLPDDAASFVATGDPIVTLQTCSGNWNEYRRLFTFNYRGYEDV